MKFRQYKNGNKYIVFDSSDSELLPRKILSVLGSHDSIETLEYNGSSIKVVFTDGHISNDKAKSLISNYLKVLSASDDRILDISTLEHQNPTLSSYIKHFHGENYDLFKADTRQRLLIAMYHFFLYDFTCNFKSTDLLWCTPFFSKEVFDVYGGFHGDILLRDYREHTNSKANKEL